MKPLTKATAFALLVVTLVFLYPAPPAVAFYDDVHYYLNYYIARVIGFTPEQAYRLAKAQSPSTTRPPRSRRNSKTP